MRYILLDLFSNKPILSYPILSCDFKILHARSREIQEIFVVYICLGVSLNTQQENGSNFLVTSVVLNYFAINVGPRFPSLSSELIFTTGCIDEPPRLTGALPSKK